MHVQQHEPISVYYGGRLVGDFFADLLVESRVIVEIQAARAIVKEHVVQLVDYLTATQFDDSLPIAFGPSVEIKRKYRIYQKRIGKH